jgi:uncharacterized protein YdeI (YjbR/CyaY-like superfamily)
VRERSGKAEGERRASQVGTTGKDLPVRSFATARAWSEWLATHHASSHGLWLKIAKKGTDSASVTYAEALHGALAWGWIDGQKGTFNDVWWLQRFTPRTTKSPWSKINRAKAEALIAAGTMEVPGLAEVERAKRDGRWERAYDGARSSSMPADLVRTWPKAAPEWHAPPDGRVGGSGRLSLAPSSARAPPWSSWRAPRFCICHARSDLSTWFPVIRGFAA